MGERQTWTMVRNEVSRYRRSGIDTVKTKKSMNDVWFMRKNGGGEALTGQCKGFPSIDVTWIHGHIRNAILKTKPVTSPKRRRVCVVCVGVSVAWVWMNAPVCVCV